MVKRVTSCLLLLALLFTFTNAYASNEAKLNEAKLKDSIMEPMAIPCDYWPDYKHRMQTGVTSSVHYKQYQHTHLIYDQYGGIIGSYNDWVCDIYKETEKYCACGYTTVNSVYSTTHCH